MKKQRTHTAWHEDPNHPTSDLIKAKMREFVDSIVHAPLTPAAQLCFAFRRWNDIDRARDIYRNTTIEITNLVRAITAREKADLTGKKLWDIQLSELANVASRLKIAFNMMDVLISGVTPQFEHELTRIVKEFKADLQEARTRKQSHTADQIGSDLQLILKEHAHSLDNLAPLLEKFLADNLNDAIAYKPSNLINSAQDMWTNLTLQFSTMRQVLIFFHFDANVNSKFQEMVGLSEGISGTLKASVGLAQEMREARSSASISASNLSEALTRMTTTTYESLERINASADPGEGLCVKGLDFAHLDRAVRTGGDRCIRAEVDGALREGRDECSRLPSSALRRTRDACLCVRRPQAPALATTHSVHGHPTNTARVHVYLRASAPLDSTPRHSLTKGLHSSCYMLPTPRAHLSPKCRVPRVSDIWCDGTARAHAHASHASPFRSAPPARSAVRWGAGSVGWRSLVYAHVREGVEKGRRGKKERKAKWERNRVRTW
ncbi:hypothetical protein B0H14DRAFT_2583652 [Mycena olivaceomarginata]|nr:hypothetical protein B0H14DRAFT_2583652 [Mycena olivaceomarginata]